ncbi:uncharacterized protein BYT42DRAFT_547237 [Radiomyces spectabilis]|uniref:uncharacterized protein n=1 Tax=Radiomyces spectabilis TaxID=64574 RepID=UPI002220B132|nr:uncharacterized protein BYT42DRAFT_547237 [Radiomyces spectabilis]KAI8374145.1 hypothetical protein BYT42DRAFT_547237 [Radiomyces spectabilis]
MHSAMAVHSILFLSVNQHSYDDISTFWNQSMYATVIRAIDGMYGIKKPRIPMNTILKVLSITQDVSTKIITRDKGIMQLIDLDLPSQEAKLIETVNQLMDKFSRNPISNEISESELGSRYIDPFLGGLFDDPDNGMYLRCTNEIILETRKNDRLASDNRPDTSPAFTAVDFRSTMVSETSSHQHMGVVFP